MPRLKERSALSSRLAELSQALPWGIDACRPPHAQRGNGFAGKAPLCRDFAVRDPTGDLGETFHLAGPPNLQDQDTDPTGGARGQMMQV